MILTLFNAFIGKMFFNAESRYEGEWKDDKRNGQGNKSALLNYLLILTLFNAFIGKLFLKYGNRYEGEWQDGMINEKGKKFDSKGKIIKEGMFTGGVLINKF